MSPIPPPEKRDKNPVQKAIEALIEETQRKGSAVIDGVIVHPNDLADLKSLLDSPYVARPDAGSTLFGTPVFVSKSAQPLPSGGPLTEAWRKQVEAMKHAPLTVGPPTPGVQVTGISFDEAGDGDDDDLLQKLQDSLWKMATLHQMVFTREELYSHVGPTHMEDDWYVKRVYPEEVHLLCKCRVILVLQRCAYEVGGVRCDEPAFPVEAALRKDTRCGQHQGR